MPSGNHRKPTSSTVKKEVIDVDAFHSRYDDPDGLVQLSSAEEFRKSWRTGHKELCPASTDRSRSRSVIAENSGKRQQAQSPTPRQVRDFPSTLGPSIQKVMSQKRAHLSETVGTPNPSKRQKTTAGPSRSTHVSNDPILSGDEWPVNPVTGSRSNHFRTPLSPDLLIVDEGPRQQQPLITVSSIKSSSKHRTSSPNLWKHDGKQPVPNQTVSPPSVASRMEIIELFSDDEDPKMEFTQRVMSDDLQYRRSVSIPQRGNSPIEFSSESEHSDDDWDPPGFDLNDPDLWLPIVNNVNKEDGLLQPIENLSIYSPPPLPRYQCQDTSRWSPPPPPARQILYVWDKLKLAQNLRWRPRPRSALMQPRKLITRSKDIDFDLHKLNTVSSFKRAPGTINAIEQFGRLTVIGSACDGGLADTPDEIPSPYNRPGSLSVWSDNRLEVLDGHQGRGPQPKHYTINDIKFDSTCNSFASTGQDKKCRIWALDDEESKWKCSMTFPYSFVPHALAFQPGSSILAVAEKRVLVYDLSGEDVVMPPHQFQVHQKGSPHIVGPIAWGCEHTADHLFASSEPTTRSFTGAHKAFDLHTQKTIYQFDTEEAGDVIAVDPVGATLGLCTQAEENHHILRLYDIRRRDSKAFASLDLVSFSRDKEGFEGEMNVATFSPDQLYLALARNDNYIHIYDRRMLGKWSSEPLFEYSHNGESKTVSEFYGVVQAQWLQSSWTTRTCLVTGGEDGCIRMWDPSIAMRDVENGKILAEVNYDISQFSIGNPFVGEYRLVVGDSSGAVTIFDHICP